ncbi:MAG: MEDS domain-containing protein [Bacteroidetes bacterium]|nr:MEDS domain-containing protein [Bacteroidota bacterium]
MFEEDNWKKSNTQDFWGEIAPCDHLLQIYDNDHVFLISLEGFAGSGFLAGDSVIIIATQAHINALNERLIYQGFDLDKLINEKKYITLDAEKTLSKFMINNWPDEVLFIDLVSGLLKNAKQNNRKVRAFGEMVALLWAKGNNGATVHLEHLWNEFCAKEGFCLFCAYPKTGFTQSATKSLEHICATHSKIISGESGASTEIIYKSA